jgi:hypothetical protein
VSTTNTAAAAPNQTAVPGTVVTDAGAAPATEAPPTGSEATPAPEPPLAEVLREYRKGREEGKKAKEQTRTLETKVQELEQKLASSARAREDLILDPAGFLRSVGVENSELALVAEALMYELMPDKAPAHLRPKLIEGQRKRDRARQEREQAEKQAQAEQEAAIERERNYQVALTDAVQTFTEADFPTSVTWFDGNHEEYAESLWHTAMNMAAEAHRNGSRADLSPKSVAAELEKFLDPKAKRLVSKRAGAPIVQDSDPKVVDQKKVSTPPRAASMQDMVGSGTGKNRPKALTEKERMQRAIEAMDKAR